MMTRKFLKIAFITMIVSLAAAIPSFAATMGAAQVNIQALNMRSAPSSYSALKTVIPQGEVMVVEEQSGGWYKVDYKGTAGYVFAQYVDFSETLDADFGVQGSVKGSSVRLRLSPSLEGGILGSVNTGDRFDIIGVSGEWVKVRSASLGECYINSQFFDCTGATTAQSGNGASVAEQLVASAKEYLGTRYVWGGMSPAGFDCSGFVNYVYDLYDYDLDRVAQDIYYNNGTYVSPDSLQVGDIVCFGWTGSSINHVGIYIGDGQFIHSGSSSTGVIITDLTSGYYSQRLQGGKRIIGA